MKSLSVLASAVLAVVASATPTTNTNDIVHSDFSIAEWVETLIADPDTALSPEAALEAFNATISRKSSEELERRQVFGDCTQVSDRRAPAAEAVWCINFLAGRNKNCPLKYNGNSAVAMCTWYNAQIVTSGAGRDSWEQIWCNDIARTAGLIMDRCTRGDMTVSGHAYPPQHPAPLIQVNLQVPTIPQEWSG